MELQLGLEGEQCRLRRFASTGWQAGSLRALNIELVHTMKRGPCSEGKCIVHQGCTSLMSLSMMDLVATAMHGSVQA